jgi:peptide/nickel transport system substrate-binding protein
MFVRTLAAALLAVFTASAQAQELSIGLSTPVTTMDPHFHNLTPNNSIAKHIFETLVHQDDQQALRPGLAESWKALDDSTWEIKLRRNVRWHDGSPFTAEDVLATLKRIPNVPNSPASFAIYTRPIADAKAKDPHTVILTTRAPHPLLPNDLATIHIISAKTAGMGTPDYNSGKAVNGTGPYKFGEYVSGDRVVLVANDKYWGPKPAFPKVRFRMITNSAARVAALLAGDVQMIEAVPTADIAKLKKDARVALASTVSNRIIYLHMDSGREKNSPFVTDAAGKPLEANPLRDPRVRKALMMAVDRNLLINAVYSGLGQPIGSHYTPNDPGYVDLNGVHPYDPKKAKALLAEAGFAGGLSFTFKSPQMAYATRSAEVLQSMFAEIGVKMSIVPTEFPAKWVSEVFTGGDFDMTIIAHAEPMDIDIYAREKYYFNYKNPAFTKINADAERTTDDAARAKLYGEAQKILADDVPSLFLFVLPKLGVWNAKLEGLWKNEPIPSNDLTEVRWTE